MKKFSEIILLIFLLTGLLVSCDGSADELLFEKSQKKSVQDLTIDDIADKVYTGSEITPNLVVCEGSQTLVKDTDYTVAYSNNVNAGTATATITGIGLYTGTLSKGFTIKPAQISDATVNSISDQAYTRSEVKPALSVSFNGIPLVVGSDYTVVFSNNIDCGTASVQLTGIGNFTGTKDTTFTIKKIVMAYKISGTYGGYSYHVNYFSSSFSDTADWEVSDATTVDAAIGSSTRVYGTAGGYVFYKGDLTIDGESCEYLEVSTSPIGPCKFHETGASHSGADTIGSGFNNTYTCLANDNFTAAKACREYDFGGKDDWFLPSSKELTKAFTLHGKGFMDMPYGPLWTSTRFSSGSAASIAVYRSGSQTNATQTDELEFYAVRGF